MVDPKKRITVDIETFPSAFIITGLVNGETWSEYVVSSTVSGYPSVVDCSVVRNWLNSLDQHGWLVTYNGKNFDLRVLTWIANCGKETLTTNEIATAASELIGDMNAKFGHKKTSPCWSAKWSDIAKLRKQHFDVLKVYTGTHSLKWWELIRGWAVKESTVPFDQPTMTATELEESLMYCRSDVLNTDKLYMEKDCREKIEARDWVISNAPCQIFPDVPDAELAEYFCYGDGDTTVEIEKAIDLVPWEKFNVPEDLKNGLKKIATGELKSFNWNNIAYGAGGAHYSKKGRVRGAKIFDVASLYPHIIKYITKLKTPEALERYVSCIDKRLENKKKKGTPEYSKSSDQGLKLVLNCLSGKFGQPGSKAYAPEHRLAMCLIGQILVTEAAVTSVKDNWDKLVEINTDSFSVCGEQEIERAREYCAKDPHNFVFEEEDFDDSFWKDVNNYFVYEEKDGELTLKEARGDVGTNLSRNKSGLIVTESLAVNLRYSQGAEVHLAQLGKTDVQLTVENCVVKWVKAANVKSANIDGEAMKFKYYYFLWVTPDCPNCHHIQLNANKVNADGTIAPRCGVYAFDLETLKQYEQYIDAEQYLEDVKKELRVWRRDDMFTKINSRLIPTTCKTFHEIKKAAGGFFSLPDDLF